MMSSTLHGNDFVRLSCLFREYPLSQGKLQAKKKNRERERETERESMKSQRENKAFQISEYLQINSKRGEVNYGNTENAHF